MAIRGVPSTDVHKNWADAMQLRIQQISKSSDYWVFLFNHSGTIKGKRLILDHFEAVRSFDGLNLHEKYIANPFLTLPRPRNGFKSWFKTDF